MDVKDIRIEDFIYELPETRIAKYPLKERDSSSLLIYNKGEILQDKFVNITHYLPKNSLMIFNNTRVIQARLHFHKQTGSLIEIFLLEPAVPSEYELIFSTKGRCTWYTMVGNLKKWKGETLTNRIEINNKPVTISANKASADILNTPNTQGLIPVTLSWSDTEITFSEILDAVGELPIPPYLGRKTEENDKKTYQTIYSKIKGSVAAPTAGLHFTNKILQDIDNKGILREEVTLHVGAGTFKPVKSDKISGHTMHTEYISVNRSTIENILKYDCKVIAVGTTSVRTIESLYYIGRKIYYNPNINIESLHTEQWEAYDETIKDIEPSIALKSLLQYMDENKTETIHTNTQILIAPTYKYKIIRQIITNFHQPQSTLLLLVSAFIGNDWKKVYKYALENNFRFLSYGDSSLLMP